MSLNVKNNIYWVGKIDWELRKFHGDEYSTHRGSSYNSYLVKEDKVALIDTVWKPFAKEFVEKLANEIDLNKIDYIIANHAESDHSGALPELMRIIPDTPIYCTNNGVKSLKGHYHQDWNFNVVKTGDKLSLGQKELIFIEAPMLHWPDSMFCYLTEDNILFSNDGFGQHYASEYMFNDLVDQNELFTECIKYYANILTPFSPMVTKKIKEVLSFNLPLDIICTSHGIIWRDKPEQIVERYLEWANDYQENQITIIYDTMWNGTRVMAENIANGIKETDKEVNVKLFNLAKTDKNDVITEIFKSKAILMGSPTINRGILVSVAAILEEIKGLRFKNKKAVAFGCYGWSGESTKIISESLKSAGFEIVDDGIKVLWNPDDESTTKCTEYGKKFVANISD
ncbi:MAG: anaerobic nitric oxide reductase flavorubredoxin [Deltaproteobacteria bacterium]|nr:anaerobic nitric oxide reductase flavorubredoxin [Deltaproteobacteria bacterium]MBW2156423.1 anaerobic nitric oxide reductase flavorubredoxin [Deltaproteobacteria bacterium]MBW2227916.1 anaerobic nitric oxide reductase flavorubredoxin [Deltaproteobacteria bacterium]MBW2327396.1 anaerobic nitric oxide reductase flavorubredoxin [Deltaproteobacteria bacterium]MBW2556501.1 anaerobic nitric oxide reductase flavorubredoxin [Deltaproteobacteria bacterium]